MAINITRLAYIHKVSKANENLLDKSVVQYDETFKKPRVRKIDILVDKDCHLVINGHSRVKVLSSLGFFSINYDDLIVDTLVIEESDVTVYAVLGY